MDICFATHNKNKLAELQSLIGDRIKLIGLDELGCHEDIPETGETLKENALIKAKYVSEKYGINCFADDTGLMIDALNGAPGVYSARYAGEPVNSRNNINLVLKNLGENENRRARFITIICLIIGTDVHYFEGVAEGNITKELSGNEGFGYDPIFVPEGYDRTFAEMSMEEKNDISHRGKAVRQLVDFLQQLD